MCIYYVVTSPEKGRITLFSESALISQLNVSALL